jgi:hypothetical protein
MKKIAKLLKADLNGTSDLAAIAAMLTSKGRGNDTLLAHITPREAEILKAAGGSGTTNPETGLLEFYDDVTLPGYDAGGGGTTDEYGLSGTGGAVPAQTPSFDPLYPEGIAGESSPATFGTLPQTREQTSQAEDVMFAGPSAGVPQGQALPTGQGAAFSPTGVQYTPRDLARISTGASAIEQPSTAVPTPQEKSFFDKLSTQDMVRLGLAGGLGIYGATQAKKGAKQAEQIAAQQRAIGEPYQAKGKELIRAAETGELTPTGQQSLQALQARLAQGAEARGGVGAAQAAAQTEAYRQQLLAQQYNLGLQVSNIGDNIALGAIKTGLQADQALNQASTNFYTNLAAIGGGIPITQTRTA